MSEMGERCVSLTIVVCVFNDGARAVDKVAGAVVVEGLRGELGVHVI